MPSAIMLLNAVNGETVWTLSRASFGYPLQVLATDPVILLQGGGKCVALNPKDGILVWERAWSGAGPLLLPDGEHIVLLTQKKSFVSLSAVNVKDGNEVWSASVENYPPAKDVALKAETAGQAVLLVGPEIVAISAKAGQTLWRKPFPGNFGTTAAAIGLGDDLYFIDGASITRSDPASGNAVWRQDFPRNAVRNLSMSGTSVFVLLREGGSDGSRETIQALERNTGKPLWKYALAEQTQSAMTIQEGRIYVTTVSQLIGIDASSGSLVFQGAIPPNLQARRLLSDVLRITEDKIIVARETGVMAVRKQDGTLLYAESVVGGAPFTYDYTMHKLNHALESATPLKKRGEFHEQTLASFSSVQYHAALAHQGAVYQRDLAMARENRAVENLNPSASDRQSGMVRGNVDAYSQLAYASLATWAASNAEFQSKLRADRTGIMSAEISQAVQSQANSLQDDFYIRPRYELDRGWSLVLVNLKTGKRAEILLSPDNDPLARSAPNLPAFSIDPSGSRIVSKGLGLDPARFETYKKWVYAPSRGTMLPAVNWKIPYPSVLSFDPATLPFGQKSGNAAPAPKPVAPEKKQLNDQLINAAFQCDLETVKKTLATGADVNAMDEYGQTALMLAAESLRVCNQKDIIQTLLESGADSSIKDPNGWMAADYYSIMGWDIVRGAEPGRKLLVKAGKDGE
jgi:outer membrane protein assembly factor BamB